MLNAVSLQMFQRKIKKSGLVILIGLVGHLQKKRVLSAILSALVTITHLTWALFDGTKRIVP